MSDVTQIHLDSSSVKVLAHPLRSRLVATLRLQGPATATELAAVLGTNSGATSYHLRRLDEAGLVVDTGDGDGKRRVWAASAESTSFEPSEFAGDPDAEAAFRWLEGDWLRHFAEDFTRWLDVQSAWPPAWGDAAGINDALVVVTAEQLRAMHEELNQVVERYRRAGEGHPDARRVAAYTASYPIDLGQAPTP